MPSFSETSSAAELFFAATIEHNLKLVESARNEGRLDEAADLATGIFDYLSKTPYRWETLHPRFKAIFEAKLRQFMRSPHPLERKIFVEQVVDRMRERASVPMTIRKRKRE
jgi:hypothetical protein